MIGSIEQRCALAEDDRMISWPRFALELVLALFIALVVMDQMLWARVDHHRHPSWHHHRQLETEYGR